LKIVVRCHLGRYPGLYLSLRANYKPSRVWNIVQAVGERQAEVERDLVEAYEKNELWGIRKCSIV